MLVNHSQVAVAIQRHRPSLCRALQRARVPAWDVDDVLQDVFSIFYQRFSDVAEPAQKSFLFNTTRNVLLDRRRLKWNRTRFSALDSEATDPCFPLPGEDLERRQLSQLIGDALHVLPEAEKNILLLSHRERYSRQQISKMLEIPAGTVASRLRRANLLFTGAMARNSESHRRAEALTNVDCPWRAPGRSTNTLVLDASESVERVGGYRFANNQWGRARAVGGYDQCLLLRQNGHSMVPGWSWNWPGFHIKGFALPEVVAGWKPWEGGRPTDPRFPVRLLDIEHLTVDFDLELTATGTFDLLFNLWLLRSPNEGFFSDPALVSTEIIVQEDHSTNFPPYGQHLERLELGRDEYDLWMTTESQGPRIEPWPLFNFRRCSRRRSGLFDVKACIAALLGRGYLARTEWLGSVEFGSGVLGGSGTAWLNRFELAMSVKH